MNGWKMLKHEEPQRRGGNNEVAVEEASTCLELYYPLSAESAITRQGQQNRRR